MKLRHLIALIPAVACLAAASPALAATSTESVSENWAGYVATSQSSDGFSADSAGWTEPSVSCTSGEATYSAFWVGLGGGEESSQSEALEQEGTQADCTASGTADYYAWYELVPSAPVKLSLKISPGDHIYARTVVSGDEVTVQVSDWTTGKTFKKTIEMTDATPDTSTAEWVAEAPSECDSSSLSDCQPLPLSDFGQVKFTNAYARSDGSVGSVTHWDASPIALESTSGNLFGNGYGGGYSGGYPGGGDSGYGDSGYGLSGDGYGDSGYGYLGGGYTSFGPANWGGSDLYDDAVADSSGDAAPSSLSDDGTSFSVSYGQAPSDDAGSTDSQTTAGSSGTGSFGEGYGDDGYGSGYGYGGGGYGGYGGYGGGGYGF